MLRNLEYADPNTFQPPIGEIARRVWLDQIKNEIEAGTYLTPDKIDAAVDRLLIELPFAPTEIKRVG